MDDTPSTRFAALLSRWCTDGDRSEAAFARLLGISPSMVSRMKRGEVAPSSATVAAACVALGANHADAVILYRELGHELPEVLRGGRGGDHVAALP